MAYLLNYTRKPMENDLLYSPRLAYSMHLAVSEDGSSFQPLNHNSGVLFVKATENRDGSLNPKSLKNPWLFVLPEGRFGIAGIRVQADGGEGKRIRITLDKDAFTVVNESGERVAAAGRFLVSVGLGQPDERTRELTGRECVTYIIEKG